METKTLAAFGVKTSFPTMLHSCFQHITTEDAGKGGSTEYTYSYLCCLRVGANQVVLIDKIQCLDIYIYIYVICI